MENTNSEYIKRLDDGSIQCTSPNEDDAIRSITVSGNMDNIERKNFAKATKALVVKKDISHEFCNILLKLTETK